MGVGCRQSIFHVMFGLSLMAAMVVIIKIHHTPLASKRYILPGIEVSRKSGDLFRADGLPVNSAIKARSSCSTPVQNSAIVTFTQENRTLLPPSDCPPALISLSTWASSTAGR